MKLIKPAAILAATALAVSLAGCSTASSSSTAVSSSAAAAVSTSYSLENAISLTFSDTGISGSGSGVEIDGTALTITKAGTYAVSGSCADGSIKVKAGTEDVVLLLNGLDLTSTTTAPIVCGKSTGVTIVAMDGTENTLADTTANNKDNDDASEDAENAVLKCKDGSQVVLCGTGTLSISAAGKNGIKSGTSNDGRDASLTIRDLTLNIDAPVNDAINAEQALNVESGTLNISAGDDAVHCDYTLNIGAEGTEGPAITITACYEGLEGADLNIYSGTIDITASDDCLNAANGDLTDYNFTMNIYGGTINAYTSEGDGFDSNGDMTITGGAIAVWTANTADNQPLDADGTITISGGTVLAAGGSNGMGCTITADQAGIYYTSAALSTGDAFTLTDADGSTVYSGTAVCNASFVFYSAASLNADSDYTLTANDTSSDPCTASTGTLTISGGFGGMGSPGGMPGQMPNGMTPPDGTNGQPQGDPDGQTPPTQNGDTNGTPPTPPTGTAPGNGGTPPERPDQNASGSSSANTAISSS